MANVIHARGKYSQYEAKVLTPSGANYADKANIIFTVTEAEADGDASKVGFIYLDGKAIKVPYKTDLGNVEVQSKMGGIAAGTKASALNGKSTDEIITMLLFPETNPTKNAPSATLKFTAESRFTEGLYEVGAALPLSAALSYSLNQGTYVVGGQTTKKVIGASTGVDYKMSNDNSTFGAMATGNFEEKTYYYRATVNHAEGEQPVTSYGNDATHDANGNAISKVSAGSINSNVIWVQGVYPIYASTATAGTLTKQELEKGKTELKYTLKGGAAQMFKVHGKAINIREKDIKGKYELNNPYTESEVDSDGYRTYTRTELNGNDVDVQFSITNN